MLGCTAGPSWPRTVAGKRDEWIKREKRPACLDRRRPNPARDHLSKSAWEHKAFNLPLFITDEILVNILSLPRFDIITGRPEKQKKHLTSA